MAKKKKKQSKLYKIKVELGGRSIELIDELVAIGLYGLDRSQVCERFVYEGLQRVAMSRVKRADDKP